MHLCIVQGELDIINKDNNERVRNALFLLLFTLRSKELRHGEGQPVTGTDTTVNPTV